MNYACPCCGYLTFDEKPCGSFEICPVCYWEDDNIQNDNPTRKGGANGVCLNEAKKNFAKFGAIKVEFVKTVRKPLPEESSRSID
ncbi:hypothetical protein BegalDRAFT_1495 [Beggiatoa alba B18LD]|uniref:Cysteine-rich CPCC domain-containing protein n=1 Tax=Beggiatoa alba B18LD TaxID=395493 RepID=I3CFI9_9GAMM|nr:CPCC family cysteine-rich protein [Beggiatoa alba]EIJ42382.1 hypothetical protein BegalDRAFT_1495 [Beggiatoa alba B18LD]